MKAPWRWQETVRTLFVTKAEPPLPEPGWRLYDLEAYSRGWEVPWGPGVVAAVLAIWAISFIAVGLFLVPGLYGLAGVKLSELSPQASTQFTLACQVAETVVSLGLLKLLTSRYVTADWVLAVRLVVV